MIFLKSGMALSNTMYFRSESYKFDQSTVHCQMEYYLFMRGITVASNKVANLPIGSHRAKISQD